VGLRLEDPRESRGEIESGVLSCARCEGRFPIVRFVPRFATGSNYSDSFGFQWNRFRKTQLDSHSGIPISRDRFFGSTGWSESRLSGGLVLDVGCGSGRFSEIALGTGAVVTAVDYSSAVDACWENLGPQPLLNVVQADVYRLPFEKHSFDFVYCLGVLQHTPDVGRAFLALVDQLREGGQIAVDVYPRLFSNLLWPKYWLRPLTRRLAPESLFRLVRLMVDLLLPLSLFVSRIPLVGRKLRYVVPVMNHAPDFPLSPEQVREWAILDTFDMYAPSHDHPQSERALRAWFEHAGLDRIDVRRRGLVVGRGVRPPTGSAADGAA